MAILSDTAPTLSDLAKTMVDGKMQAVVELLDQSNPVLMDVPYIEGNQTAGHITVQRTGLPTAYWRLLNQGVPSSKTRTVQVEESCGMLEARSEIDADLVKMSSDIAKYRLQQSRPFMESLGQEMAATLFYGNTSVSKEEFNGLSVRYSSLSAGNAQNIVSGGAAGGQTDCSSIWLIGWGENTIHGIYPKGTQAGLQHEDLGVIDAFDSDNNRFRAYADLYKWKCGIALADWRYVVRIPNIDISVLVANSAPADLLQLMTKATHRVPNLDAPGVRWAFYMNRTVFQMLDIQAYAAVKAGGQLKYDEVDGKRVVSFRGIPIRITDALHQNESVVA